VFDQGQLGSCTANAICGAYCFEMMKQNEAFVPMSRLFLYYLEREMEGNIDQDSGAEIHDGIAVTETQGMCLESLWPYDISKFTEKPNDKCYDDLKLHKTVTAERVKQDENDMKQCLLDGFPIVFGFQVYDSFESPETAKTGIVKMPDTTKEKLLGGHAISANGFININGTDYFIIRNSWGSQWGDKGYCYMPFEYVLNTELASDFWCIKLTDDQKDSNIVPTKETTLLDKVKKIIDTSIEGLNKSDEYGSFVSFM
jgi:C1A family cysteine protease